jgi:hypothetical protein
MLGIIPAGGILPMEAPPGVAEAPPMTEMGVVAAEGVVPLHLGAHLVAAGVGEELEEEIIM